MQNVVITGGAGFIGSHLIECLVNEDVKITILDDFTNGSRKNFESYKDQVEVIEFDISNSNWDHLSHLNPDTIFHLAVHPRSFSLQDPKRNMEVNVLGTLNVFEFARKKNSKVIYTSNSGICGDPKFFPVTEDHPIDCKTPYDANKLIGEHYAKIFFKIYGVPSVIFRLATVYGERQTVNIKLGWKPIIANLVQTVENNQIPIINWDGEQTRDLIYVKDVVNCLILGAKSKVKNAEMFLLSTNKETSVNEAYKIICEITGKKITPKYQEKLPGDLRRMILSYEKAKNAFGYVPKYTVHEGIRRYIEWYRAQNSLR